MMKRRGITLLLVLALVLTLSTGALAAGSLSNFRKVNSFREGQFWDVSSVHWAYSNVRSAYEYGLMKGESDTAFAPDSSLTVGATITMAARLHSIYYTGTENFVQGNPWYQVYVDYALRNGLITGEYANYDAAIQRWEFAQILGRALPDTALQAINTVEDGAIPDVAMSAGFAADVYRLYRAGILTGSGEDGSFTPYTGILRSEAAAIVSRMVEPELRKRFTLSAEAELEPVAVSSLPGGLTAFLNQFYGCYGSADDREYHSAAAAGSDILASLVSNPSCVDTRLYPGEQPRMHWMDGTTDPRGWCGATLSYGQFDQDQVDWIARNIFHVSDSDLAALRTEGERSGRFYLQDGYYYTPIGGVGGFFYEARPTRAVTDGSRYYLAYDVYFTADGEEYWDTCYAVLGRETIGGVQYWTLYDHTHTPLPELSADDQPESAWSAAYADFVLKKQYLSAGQNYEQGSYSAEIRFFLYDMDGDGTPELIVSNGSGAMGGMVDYVYTCRDGAVDYAGSMGLRGADYWAAPGSAYPGLFLYGGNMDLFQGLYYTLRGGAVERTAVTRETPVAQPGGGFTYAETVVTTDAGLYAAYAQTRGSATLPRYTYQEIVEMGWETFAG